MLKILKTVKGTSENMASPNFYPYLGLSLL